MASLSRTLLLQLLQIVLLQLLLLPGVLAGALQPQEEPPVMNRQEFCEKGSCLTEILAFLRGNFQVLPGLNISASGILPDQNATSISDILNSYVKSLTLHVAVYNEPILSVVETAGAAANEVVTGRAKKKRQRFQFLSVYTVFAIAFALLSALVGKAMTMSIVSLVITLIIGRAVNRGDANANANSPAANTPVFDFVRRPQIQVQHTHSSEDVYEVPAGGTSGGAVSYVYASSPHRGRTAVPDPYSPFAPNAVHISSLPDPQPDSGGAVRHLHVSERSK